MFPAFNNVHPLSYLYLPYLPLAAFWFSLPPCPEFLHCLLVVCLLACFFSLVQTQCPGYCSSLFSNFIFPVISFLLFRSFPFVCLSLFFLFSSIFSASFSPLWVFSPLVIPSSSPKITNLFLFLSTFHSVDYSFQRLMNLACSWNI